MDLCITNEFLFGFTATMPMRQIDIGGKPYLQRYYLGTTHDDRDIWVHRFLHCDGERHLHSHPFIFRTVMLSGWYVEELEGGAVRVTTAADIPSDARFLEFIKHRCGTMYADHLLNGAGQSREIGVFDWHRIAEVAPETWTLMIVEPDRLPYWFFRDDQGRMAFRKSTGRDWWKGCGAREGVAASVSAL